MALGDQYREGPSPNSSHLSVSPGSPEKRPSALSR
jgi:hypothetical protein